MGPSAQGFDPDTGVVAIMKGEVEAKRVTMMEARPMNTAVLSIEGILADSVMKTLLRSKET